ncbi:hypothetical protein NQ315_007722 [Exocentrus adspersus]|uniref:Uncharacterized protein n=1 Tax=Exocentrus adspersus TaxID=1586481 RepID=A0AAV8W849_9CUCU|nr:hypothetical protein NQ315_007722 [Exocentrus adspersus]
MSLNYLLLVFLLNSIYISNSVSGEDGITTTRIYDLDVPGARPIRIVEGENLWKSNKNPTLRPTSRFEHRSFTTDTASTNLNNPISDEEEDNSAEFTHSALKDFLNSYADKVAKEKHRDRDTASDEDKEGKKSWSLLNTREHNHPYEDKKGWVTLEPVPWSLSKISKWQSKSTTTERPWGGHYFDKRPANDVEYSLDRVSSWNKPPLESNYHYNRPEIDENNYQSYYPDEDKPTFPKPSAVYGQTVHLHTSTGFQKHPVKPINHHKHNCNQHEHDGNVGIITDGRPPNFPPPSYGYENRRTGTELQPEPHPHMGEGEWVLLSTTKGYKAPKNRQRSLDINPQAIGTHQAVSLTVLPPLKGSKVNMTTSHGGLLQVDSTFETVEQAQKKFVKLQKMKDTKVKRPIAQKKRRPTKELTSSTIATIPRSTPPDSSAVLAAVGAGMIPATMAMLVPIAMNGRKRRRRSARFDNGGSSVQITLPRYLL